MKKKILSVICIICILFTSLSVTIPAYAENNTSIEFSIFGVAEKQFTISSSTATYKIADLYQEKDNKPIGISATAGIIGHPVDAALESGSDDADATVSFKYDPMLLNNVEPEKMRIAKFDSLKGRMTLIESTVDIDTSTVSANGGAGQYALVDSKKWYEAWKESQLIIRDTTADVTSMNVIFVIDVSGSMSGDKNKKSIDSTLRFFPNLNVGDRFTVIGFDDSATTVIRPQNVTRKTNFSSYESILEEDLVPNGGTDFDAGLNQAMGYVMDDRGYNDLIIMLSDGESSISSSTLDELNKSGAHVATIGLETTSSGRDTLTHIASETGGLYYDAETDSMSSIFDNIREETIGVDINDDADGDGLPDKVETSGMRTRFGEVIKTKHLLFDTDGDGYSDLAEIGEAVIDTDISEFDKENGLGRYVFFTMFSDPLSKSDTPVNSSINRLCGFEYIYYDNEADIKFDNKSINNVKDKNGAASYYNNVLDSLSSEQKNSTLVSAKLGMLRDELASKSAIINLSSRDTVNINDTTISYNLKNAQEATQKLQEAAASKGIELSEPKQRYITMKTDCNEAVTIKKEAMTSDILGVKVVTPFATVRIPPEVEDDITLVNITKGQVGVYFGTDSEFKENPPVVDRQVLSNAIKKEKEESVIVPIKSKDVTTSGTSRSTSDTSILISIDGFENSSNNFTVIQNNDSNDVLISKLNDVTGKIDANVNASGIYSTMENKILFDDIKGQPQSMKAAINMLASHGIINGMTPTEFSPQTDLTRAQMATIMARLLFILDPNEDGNFSDVTKNDWFFGAAGSAKKGGIINGFEDNTFRGNNVISQYQITSILSRTLSNQPLGYDYPSDISYYLTRFTDKNTIADWAKKEIAFAAKYGLLCYRIDETFGGDKSLSRGNSCIEIYKLFQRIYL